MKKKVASIVVALCIFLSICSTGAVSAAKAQDNETIVLYALDDRLSSIIKIPDSYPTKYTISIPKGMEDYRISVLGECVSVDGITVKPKASEITTIGGVSGSVSTNMEYSYGISPVIVTSNDKSYCKTYYFEVKDYSDKYVEEYVDNYIKNNIPNSLSVEEKLNKIGEFIASYDYNVKYQSIKSMILYGEGGDCWASTDAAVYFCERLCIQARACSDKAVSIFSGGHMYAVAEVGTENYIIEAGFDGTAPRFYDITKLTSPFSYKNNGDGTCTLVSYFGCSNEIVVPEKIDGLTLTKIDKQCFYLANMYIDNGIKKIVLPNTITSVGISAFYGCKNLEYINIPASLSEIEMSAFSGCEKLNPDIAANGHFIAENGIIYSKDKKSIICAYAPQKNCVIENGVEIINDCAFYDCDLDSISFPNTLKDIGYNAFYNCKLTNQTIVLPKSVTGIGYGAFSISGNSDITILNKDCVINNTPEEDLYLVDDGNTISAGVIYGYSGSTAQAYAEKHERTFHSPCESVLKNGKHSIKTGGCENTAVCSSCGVSIQTQFEHNYVYSHFGYYSNSQTPFIAHVCSVCGNTVYDTLRLKDLISGDVDMDGKVTSADARLALRKTVGLENFDALEFFVCNYDNDDSITSADARLILRKSVNLI